MLTHLGTWYLYLGKIALRNCLTILIHFSSCWTLSFYYQGLCYHSGSCKLTVYLKGMVISSALAKAISSSGFKVIMNQCTPNLEVETTLSTPKKDSPLSSSSHSLWMGALHVVIFRTVLEMYASHFNLCWEHLGSLLWGCDSFILWLGPSCLHFSQLSDNAHAAGQQKTLEIVRL